jgi:periplasmic copper chaperone A
MRAFFAAVSFAAAAVLAGPSLAHDFKAGALVIDHPTVSPQRGQVPVVAGYMDIRNTGRTADRLLSASSPDAGRVEIHTHERGPGGVMRMRPVAGGVAIPAGRTISFRPGGLHLMVYDPKERVDEGDVVEVALVFEKAGRVTVGAIAETPQPGRQGHGHGAHAH